MLSSPPGVFEKTVQLREVAFQMKRDEGLKAQSEAAELFRNKQTEAALERLQSFLDSLDECQLSPEQKTLLLSGLLVKATSIAERAIVVNAHVGSGNVLLFANNPVYRGETVGSYNLVFNAILNYDHLRQPIAAAGDQPAKAVSTVR